MFSTIFLITFALIKVIYIIFFLALVAAIHISFIAKAKKKTSANNNSDIYMRGKRDYRDTLDRITSKN